MGAAPVTFGQEAGGWARQVELSRERLLDVLPRLGELPLGGTAVGTGLNAPPRFARNVIAVLASDMGLPLTEAIDHFEAQSAQGAVVEAEAVASGGSVVAQAGQRPPPARLGSRSRAGRGGPPRASAGQLDHAGQGEPRHPRGDPAGDVRGGRQGRRRHVAATLSTFELNTAMPVMARSLLTSLRLLATSARCWRTARSWV